RSSGEVVPAGGRAAAVRDRGGGRAGGGLRADAAGLSPGVEAAERAAAAVRPDQVPVVPPDDRRRPRADPGAPPGLSAPRAGRDDDRADLGAGGRAGVRAGRMLVDPRGQLGHAAGNRARRRPGVQDVPGLRESTVNGDRARAGARAAGEPQAEPPTKSPAGSPAKPPVESPAEPQANPPAAPRPRPPRAVDRLFALYMLASGLALAGSARPGAWPVVALVHGLAAAAVLRWRPVAPALAAAARRWPRA